MTTDELIRALRDRANEFEIMRNPELYILMNETADRLEELDERVAIMAEPKKEE